MITGSPARFRTDNGAPFAPATRVFGLSKLSVWWLGLGIRIERTNLAIRSKVFAIVGIREVDHQIWLFVELSLELPPIDELAFGHAETAHSQKSARPKNVMLSLVDISTHSNYDSCRLYWLGSNLD